MLKRIETKLIKVSQSFFYFLIVSINFLIFSTFTRIKIEGKENIPKKGTFILCANHQNFFDGFFLAFTTSLFKRITFIIAKRALRLGLYQTLVKLMGAVLIGNAVEDYHRALKKLNRILAHGGAVGIFPEGDISNHNLPRRFKAGVAKLSLDSKTKVIPVYIRGTYKLRFLKYFLTRPQVLIRIGKPIELYNYAADFGNNLDRLASLLRDKVIELMELEESKKNKNLISDNSKALLICNTPQIESFAKNQEEEKIKLAR